MRAGFLPATRRQVFDAIKHLKTAKCPFVNLPEKEAGRWGQGFTAEKMQEAIWLKPKAVAQIEFLEWTGANHLRHTKFVGQRDDKDPPQHCEGDLIAMDEEGWERYELYGKMAYQLDICDAIHDHHLCPGVTVLRAGDHELGPVFCNCPCHKKPDSEVCGTCSQYRPS